METFKDFNKSLRKSAKKGGTDFLNTYLDNEDAILTLLKAFDGVKSEIYLKEVNSELHSLVRFSSVFSDLTTLNTSPSGRNDTQISYFTPEHRYFRERQISIPGKLIPEIGTDPKRLLPCYYHRNDQEIRKLFQDFKPLLESEKLLVRPLRGLYVGFPEVQSGNLYYVDPNTSNNHWYINEKNESDFVTIDNGLSLTSSKTLFEITLPFFSNIGLDSLAKVLEDENDSLGSFRLELKKIVQGMNVDKPNTVTEVIQDVLRPKIEQLNKRFSKIQNRHRLGVGIAVGSFALSFTLATLQGKNIFEALGTFGAGAIGAMLLSNADYNDKMSDFKDDAFYLLWRIKRLS